MVHAHLACAAVASGVECAVVVDADRARVWQAAYRGHVSIASATPLGGMPEVAVDLQPPEAPDGARWIAARPFAAGDFAPCAVTTVRGELDGDGGALWRGSIELPRRGCAPPRERVAIACEVVGECRGWGCAAVVGDDGASGGGEPFQSGEAEAVVVDACTISFDPAPPVPLRVYVSGIPPIDVGAHQSSASFDVDDLGDGFARIQIAITTASGAPVWHGHPR